MRLIDALERKADTHESFFQAHLLREDCTRLARMRELARIAVDATAFRKSVMCIGWTAGDLRTHEIRDPLTALADAVYAYERDAGYRAGAHSSPRDRALDSTPDSTLDSALETRIEQAWEILHRVRMERLVGCLSTPVPKPVA